MSDDGFRECEEKYLIPLQCRLHAILRDYEKRHIPYDVYRDLADMLRQSDHRNQWAV